MPRAGVIFGSVIVMDRILGREAAAASLFLLPTSLPPPFPVNLCVFHLNPVFFPPFENLRLAISQTEEEKINPPRGELPANLSETSPSLWLQSDGTGSDSEAFQT